MPCAVAVLGSVTSGAGGWGLHVGFRCSLLMGAFGGDDPPQKRQERQGSAGEREKTSPTRQGRVAPGRRRKGGGRPGKGREASGKVSGAPRKGRGAPKRGREAPNEEEEEEEESLTGGRDEEEDDKLVAAEWGLVVLAKKVPQTSRGLSLLSPRWPRSRDSQAHIPCCQEAPKEEARPPPH